MDQVLTRVLRVGAIVLLAVAFVSGVCGESAAQTVERSSSQPRETASRSRGSANAMASSAQQAGPGPMRYYGGPKSPMWRGPSAN
jgi:hypothetical protein